MKTLLQLAGVSKNYGLRTILDGVSFAISEKQRVGVVGRNGAGKSTLFRIITGEEQPDAGTVTVPEVTRLGYLAQHDDFEEGETVSAYLQRKTGRQAWECARMVHDFAMTREQLAVPVLSLSGGYRMRVKLSALFLLDPNIVLLDEPTNYLDVRTQLLLEDVLRAFRGAFLVISHDREFLKRTCEETLELERGRAKLFPGTIEEYLAWKEEDLQRVRNENEKTERAREHMQGFIDRFRYQATKASQVQSRIKALAKMHTVAIDHPLKSVRMTIPCPPVKKGVAVSCDDVSLGYAADKAVATGVQVSIARGEHVLVVGDNGQGKSTFLKTIAGKIPPLSGTVKWGQNLVYGMFTQHTLEMLDEREVLLAFLQRSAAVGTTEEQLLRMAGNFLFSKDDLERTVATLSGGEKARLALAGLLLEQRTCLIFDEPTNHLDFETVEVLGAALREYPGTLFVVTHNRTFAHLIAGVVLEVADGAVKRFPGDFDAYVESLAVKVQAEEDAVQEAEMTPSAREQKKFALKDAVDAARKRLRACENTMSICETEKAMLHNEYLVSDGKFSRSRNEKLVEVTSRLRKAEEEWLSVQEEIVRLQDQIKKL